MKPVLYALMVGTFALGTDLFVMAGVLPRIAMELGVGLDRAGWLVSVFALVYGSCAPLLAAALAGLSRRRAALAALGTFAVANGLSALAPGFGTLLASRILAALGAAAFAPLAAGIAATSVAPQQRGRALSLVLGGTAAATVLGSPLGTWMANAWGWRSTFAAVSALALLAMAGLLANPLARTPAAAASGLRQRLAPLARREVLLALLPLVLWTMAAFNLYTYLPALLAGAGGAQANLELLLLVYGLGGVVGAWLGGRMADRFGARRPQLVGLLALAAVFAAWPWLALGTAATASAMFAWGVAGWSLYPPQQHRLVSLDPANAGVLLGLVSSALYLGITLGSLLGGLLLRAAPRTAQVLPWTSAGLVAAAFLMLAAARGRTATRPGLAGPRHEARAA